MLNIAALKRKRKEAAEAAAAEDAAAAAASAPSPSCSVSGSNDHLSTYAANGGNTVAGNGDTASIHSAMSVTTNASTMTQGHVHGGSFSASAAQIRVQRDVSDLKDSSLPNTIRVDFPDANDLFHFQVTIQPDNGIYRGGTFHFFFTIPRDYPHEPPKAKCLDKIYHPNIDLEGNVCLNILREDWKPVLSLVSVLMGLQHLFLEPNAEDPLNKDAAMVLKQNKDIFVRNVANSMLGRDVNGVRFDRVK